MTALSLAASTPPGAVAATPPVPADSHWARWLYERINASWRPTEWQPQFWLFTGNPDEPRTSVSLCRTAACQTLVSPTNSYCPLCKHAQKQSLLPDEEFARTFVPDRTRVYFGAGKQAISSP